MKSDLRKKFDDTVAAFVGRISGDLQVEIHEVSVVEGADEPFWKNYGPWASLPGVYAFLDENQFLYVGRALQNTGIGNRVWSHCLPSHYPETTAWGAVIRDPKVTVRICSFQSPEANYWVAALELYLIDKLQPTSNAKTG